MRSLTSADLFSGAGGLTEGFHQAGFEILASLDNWGPAAETHWKNFPDSEMFHADILEFDPAELPKVDVLVGSPPCTEFSYSNRGGHGDLALGMRFVLRFLRFVHDTKPRFWAMENVPRLAASLPPRVPLRRLGLKEDGYLDIPVRKVLNSAEYGAPQRRLRLFSGKFPLPAPTHYGPGALDTFDSALPWVTVQDVLDSLPDPLQAARPGTNVTDPNYGLKIPVEELSDHFMDTVLTPEEVQINRKSKTDHSWYGRMAFPDPTDRPARTVMATQTGVSRETLVLGVERGGKKVYRRPTIRECATFQTFPLTYQFWGRTAETRYKLVGNAVPPMLAAAVASAIARKVGVAVPRSPGVARHATEMPPAVGIARRRDGFNARRFPVDRRFRDHLPGSRAHGFRVDLDNGGHVRPDGSTVGSARTGPAHFRLWTARLFIGSGKNVASVVPSFEQAIDQLASCSTTADYRERAARLGTELESKVAAAIPDATTLQAVWAGKVARRGFGPHDLLWRLTETVDACFPPNRFEGVKGPVSPAFPSIERTEMPIRTAAFLLSARFATEIINGKAPGESLGATALEQFALQSGAILQDSPKGCDAPRAGALISEAIQTRAAGRGRRSSLALGAV